LKSVVGAEGDVVFCTENRLLFTAVPFKGRLWVRETVRPEIDCERCGRVASSEERGRVVAVALAGGTTDFTTIGGDTEGESFEFEFEFEFDDG